MIHLLAKQTTTLLKCRKTLKKNISICIDFLEQKSLKM